MVAPQQLSETLFDTPVRDVADYLERAESLALARIMNATQGLGESTCEATGLREHIRAHPLLATTASAVVGAVLGPVLVRTLSGNRATAAALATRAVPTFAWVLEAARRQLLAQRVPPL